MIDDLNEISDTNTIRIIKTILLKKGLEPIKIIFGGFTINNINNIKNIKNIMMNKKNNEYFIKLFHNNKLFCWLLIELEKELDYKLAFSNIDLTDEERIDIEVIINNVIYKLNLDQSNINNEHLSEKARGKLPMPMKKSYLTNNNYSYYESDSD
jgi:hypothetical protein